MRSPTKVFLAVIILITFILISAWAIFNHLQINKENNINISFEGNPDVVFIGDSIIAGHPAHYSELESNSKKDLNSTIEQHYYYLTNSTYRNMGIGGQTTTEIRMRFDRDVIKIAPSKLVVIEGGVNDIAQGVINQSIFLDNYDYMFQKCTNLTNITCLVIKILPWTKGNNTYMQKRDQWNANLTIKANSYGVKVVDASIYVGVFRVGGDVGNLWDINRSYDVDKVHFNSEGHKEIAYAILDALKNDAS